MKAKTRDRILAVALDLLNEEGEQNLSAVDIAAALEISPGHLYYHFKGKTEIVAALFQGHVTEMTAILNAASREVSDLEGMWTHVQIMFEEINDCRFLYRNLDALMARDDDLRAGMRKLIGAIRGAVSAMLKSLTREGHLPKREGLLEMLCEQVVMALLFRLTQQAIEDQTQTPREQVARAALHTMTLVAACAASGED